MPPVTRPARVGEFRFRLETVANDPIASPAGYWADVGVKKLKAWDIKPGNDHESEDDPSMVLHALEDRERLLLAKKSTMALTCWLTGLTPTTPAQDDLGLLLKGAFGGESLGPASTTIAVTNTGAGFTVGLELTSVAGLAVGQALKIVTSSRTELRRIINIAGSLVQLDQNLAAVYTSGTVYGSATYYPDPEALYDLNDALHLTFAALFRGASSEEQVQHRGCFFGAELADVGVNKRPKLNVSVNGQDWDYTSGIAAGTAFTEPASPNQINNGLYINPQATGTVNVIPTTEIDIKLGLQVEAQMSPNGENGVIGHLAFGGRTVVEFTTFFAVSTWYTAYAAGTKFYAGYQIGNNVLISFPQLSIDKAPEAVGSGAQPRGVKVSMHANNGPLTTNDLTLARFAIHRFGST